MLFPTDQLSGIWLCHFQPISCQDYACVIFNRLAVRNILMLFENRSAVRNILALFSTDQLSGIYWCYFQLNSCQEYACIIFNWLAVRNILVLFSTDQLSKIYYHYFQLSSCQEYSVGIFNQSAVHWLMGIGTPLSEDNHHQEMNFIRN